MSNHQSQAQGSQKPSPGGESRTRKIEQIIIKSRLSCSLPVPDDKELQIAVVSWGEIIEPIATDWLNECYVRAGRFHQNDKPFAAALLLRAWSEANASGEVEASRVNAGNYLPAGPRYCEYNCSFEGWISVDNGSNFHNGVGYAYARPCPIHRQAVKHYPNAAPYCHGEWPRR